MQTFDLDRVDWDNLTVPPVKVLDDDGDGEEGDGTGEVDGDDEDEDW